ncbi:hypothetical protein btBTE5EL_001338 (plasmid) [Borrelia turicatae]|nr:hypothetical protein btBTE5EL_001338 [Borrelia turicatae]
MSCNNSGTAPKDGQAAKSDGTVIDLATITKNITDAVAFAKSVKEVSTLVKSIDELAKAIGKKIQNQDTLADEANQNGSLLAGVFQVMVDVKVKLEALEKTAGIFDEVKGKVTSAKAATKKFLDTVKGANGDLGKKDASDENAKKAIDRVNKADGDKGVAELIALNTAIDTLLKAANDSVETAINALSTPAKSASTAQSNKG